jgi:hypothetical protein
MRRHLHVTRLGALLEPDLDAAWRGDADAHLEGCAVCRRRLEELEQVRVQLAAEGAALKGFDALEKRVMSRVLAPVEESTQSSRGISHWLRAWAPAPSRPAVLRVVAVAGLVLVVIFVATLYQRPSQAWTLEQSVAAVRPMQGVYFEGTLEGEVGVRMWARGRSDRMQIDDMLFRADNGLTIQVHGNRTVFHMAGEPVAYTDDAQTAGIAPWPGAAFLDMLRQASSSYEIDSRLDVLRLTRLSILRAQLVDSEGPKSFELEFDPRSKLLTKLAVWRNLQRQGAPTFAARVQYYTEMSDALFVSGIPENVVFRERPVSIPSEMMSLLASGSGVRVAGASAEEAGRQIVEDVLRAIISRDVARIRQLAPVTTLWTDAQLEAVFRAPGGQDFVTDLVSVGEARARGESSLGPLLVVPVVVRRNDGRLYDQKIIVQVRHAGDAATCVVYGPYAGPIRVRKQVWSAEVVPRFIGRGSTVMSENAAGR